MRNRILVLLIIFAAFTVSANTYYYSDSAVISGKVTYQAYSAWYYGRVYITRNGHTVYETNYHRSLGAGYPININYNYKVPGAGTYVVFFSGRVEPAGAASPSNVHHTIKQVVYLIDTTPPTTPTVSRSSVKPTWAQSVTYTLSSRDYQTSIDYYEYMLGNKNDIDPWKNKGWHPVTNNKHPVTSNDDIIKFRAMDAAGNPSAETEVLYVDNIDNEASISNIDLVRDTANNVVYATIEPSLEDTDRVAEYQMTFKGITKKDPNNPKFTLYENGIYTFKYVDTAGNVSSGAERDITVLDETPPAWSDPWFKATFNSVDVDLTEVRKDNILITFFATDSEGVNHYKVQKDGGDWIAQPELQDTYEITSNGSYSFKAVDAAGNESSISTLGITNIDKEKPQLGEIKLRENLWLQNHDVVLTATDNVGISQYGMLKESGEWLWLEPGLNSFTVSKNGTYSFKAKDTAGNESLVKTFTVDKIDREGPTFEVVSNTNGWNNSNVIINTFDKNLDGINTSGVDTAKWSKTVDGLFTGTTDTISIDPINFIQGSNTIYLELTDKAGNVTKDSVSVKFDNVKPKVELARSNSNGYTQFIVKPDPNDTSTIDFNSSRYALNSGNKPYEAMSDLEISNLVWIDNTNPDFLRFNEGLDTHILLEVRDLAGNISREGIHIDTKAPELKVRDVNNEWTPEKWINSGLTLKLETVDSSAIDKIQYKINNSWTEIVKDSENSATLTINPSDLNQGINNFPVRAYDAYGNYIEEVVTIKYDTKVPGIDSLNIVNPDNEAEVFETKSTPEALQRWITNWYNKNVKLVVNKKADIDPAASSDITVSYSLDGSNYTLHAPTLLTELNADKKAVVYVKVADEAGNEIKTEVEVNLDTILPVFTTSAGFVNSVTNGILIVSSLPTITDSSLGLNYSVNAEDFEYSFNGSAPWQILTKNTNNEIVIQYQGNTLGTNKVYFRFKDRSGNYSIDGVEFVYDNAGPEISNLGSLDNPYVNIDTDNIVVTTRPTWSDVSSTIDERSLQYHLSSSETLVNPDNVTWTNLADTGVINIPNTLSTEGTFYVHYKVLDSLGNPGHTTTGLKFYIDKTAPVINSFKAYEKVGDIYTPVENKGYSKELDVYIEPVSADRFGNNGTGEIAKYIISKSKTFDGNYTEELPQDVNTQNKYIVTLTSGANYIKVTAIDKAGNRSVSDIILPVVVDNGIPENLVITSTTHKEAFSEIDTAPYTTAYFNFSADAGASGIEKYNYKLYEGYESDYNTGSASLIKEGTTYTDYHELADLTDNQGDRDNNLYGYYYLEVSPVAANGNIGLSKTYKFRVDTKAPANLTINSVTHPMSSLYYMGKDSIFTWQEPTDLTGIKKYYYTFIDHGTVSNIADELSREDINNWSETTDRRLEKDLNSFVKDTNGDPLGFGEVTLRLCAEDWAGHKQFDNHTVKFDVNKPVLDPIGTNPVIFFNIGTNSYSDSIDYSFTWKTPKDLESGIKKQTLRLEVIEGNQFKQVYPAGDGSESLSATETSFSISGLFNRPLNYRLVLTIFDNAGNKTEYNQFFDNNGTIDENPNYSLPFDNFFYGYRVKGQTLQNPFADLYMPRALDVKQNVTVIETVPLENLNVSEFTGGTYTLTNGVDESLNLTIGGFNIDSYGLSLSSAGLAFSDVLLNLDTTTLNFANDIIISSPRALSVKYPVSSVSDIKTFRSSNNWIIESATNLSFTLYGEELKIDNGTLPIEQLAPRGFRISRGLDPVSLTNIVLGSDKQIKEADFDSSAANPFIIETEKYKLKVNSAILRDNRIAIEDGEFIVDNLGLAIPFKDVIVFYDGRVVNGQTFSSSPFSYTLDGVTYTVTGNVLLTDSGLSVSGSFTFEGKNYEFSNQIINRDSVDSEIAADINTTIVIDDFGGYLLTATNVKLKGSDIYINEASIKLPADLGDVTGLTSLNNSASLILNGADFKVKQAGTWVIRNEVLESHAFGKGLSLRSIKLSEEITGKQVSFPEVTVSLNSSLNAPVITFNDITINNLVLNRDTTFGSSDITSTATITVGDFEYEAKNLRFDLDRVLVSELKLVSADSLDSHLNNLVFEGFSFNGLGVQSFGESLDTRLFNVDGWKFTLSKIKQAGSALISESALTLPKVNGGRDIVFDSFILGKGGFYQSGTTSYGQFFNIGGWRVFGKNISVDNSGLTVGEGLVRLFSTMGGETLTFNDIKLLSDGSLALATETVSDVVLLAENGFEVLAKKYKLDSEGILLQGKIMLPDALQNIEKSIGLNYSDFDLLLKSNGYINTLKSLDNIQYQFAGFTISASGVSVTNSGLQIESNTLLLDFIDKNLGSIDFFSTGEIKRGGKDNTPFTFEPFGSNAVTFTVRSIELTESGVNLKSFVSLPKSFATEEIFFDKLTLHSDGTITSDAAVPKLAFKQFGTHFDFRDIYLDGDGFSIGEATITLPETMENKQVTLNNFRIGYDGKFEIEDSSIDPFDMWGYTFYLDEIAFGSLPSSANDGILFKGAVRLPVSFPVKELAGRKLNINQLEVPYNGAQSDIKFNVGLIDPIHMRLFNSWDMVVTGVSIDQDFKLIIDNGTVELPKEFNTLGDKQAQLTINNITIDPVNLTMDVKSVTADNLSYKLNGLDFKIEQLSLSQDRGLDVIEGSVLIPKNDPDNPKFPEGLDNTTLTIHKFQVKNDFTVGDFEVSVSKAESLPILGGLVYLEPIDSTDWKLALLKSGNDVVLAASASARLGNRFPAGISGKKLTVGDTTDSYGIKVNVVTGSIERFLIYGDFRDPVTGEGMRYSLFGNSVETDELGLKYVKADNNYELEVKGTTLTLDGSSVPSFIKGTVSEVTNFKINDKGNIKTFESTFTLSEKREFFPGIYMENWKLGVEADDINDRFIFSVIPNGINGNQVELGGNFPTGIKGTRSNINNFSIDSNGVIGDIDFNVTLSSDLKLFGDLVVRGLDANNNIDVTKGAQISFTKVQGGRDFLVSLKAGAQLSDSLPTGFAGLEIPVRAFDFYTNGTVKNLDMGIADLNMTIYDQLRLESGSLNVIYESSNKDEMLFDFGGSIVIPQSASSVIGGVSSFDIRELRISSRSGVEKFNAGITGAITAELYAGITFTFNRINISDSGLSLSGKLDIPSSVAYGFRRITLEDFSVNWSGEITNISAGLDHITVRVGGFYADITNLIIGKDKITVDSFMISLPQEFGGMKLGFNNAGFDKNGKFFGTCAVDKLVSPEIAGFKVVLYNPDLDVSGGKLSFDKVYFKTPDFVGGFEVGVTGVKVTSDSLVLSGVEFGLPDFTLGDGLGFKDVNIKFSLDGSKYMAAGGGSLMVPGLGTFNTAVSFVNKSRTYPIGLEYARFEWYAYGPGIAMGNTGMFLNGIRGGITFGPPNELPPILASMFDDGTRIQLGLRVVDGSGGHLVKGDANIWIDITDWDWAFKGDLVVMHGLASAEVMAAITGRGFVGRLEITRNCINGKVDVYIFDHRGETLVTGDARVRFGFKKGYFVDKKVAFVRVRIPWRDFWFREVGAQFGRFYAGSGSIDGVKGYAKVPLIGTVSAFVTYSGGLRTFGVNNYKLYTPYNSRSRSFAPMAMYSEPVETNIINMDTKGRNVTPEVKKFRVGAVSSSDQQPEEVERTLIVVAFKEGEPKVSATSPTGKVYTAESEGIEVERHEWGMAFAILEPEAGEWTLKVDNMPSEDSYDITIYGTSKGNELTVGTFGFPKRAIKAPYTVKGAVTPKVAGKVVDIYATDKHGVFTGYRIGETVTDINGEFDAVVDPLLLDDGEVFVYANVGYGENPDLREFFGGSLYINNSNNKLPKVENVLLSENEDKGLVITYNKLDNGRVKNYRLSLVNRDNPEENYDVNLGQLDRFVIPGLKPATYAAIVTAIDNNGLAGEQSNEKLYTIGESLKDTNNFTLSQRSLNLEATVGGVAESAIDIVVNSPRVTDSSYDYAEVEITSDSNDIYNIGWEIYPNFVQERVNISSGRAAANLKLNVSTDAIPGTYNYTVKVYNLGNPGLFREIPVSLTVKHPTLIIESVTPNIWEAGEDEFFEVYGSGFIDGTKLLINGVEVPTLEKTYNRLKAKMPQNIEQGDIVVTVVAPNNDRRDIIIEGIGPTWSLISYKSYTEVAPGNKTSMFFSIAGEDGFDGTVLFNAVNLPQGWSGSFSDQYVNDGVISSYTVDIPADTAEGYYFFNITDSKNNTIPCEVLVTNRSIAPSISSISDIAIIPGDEFDVFGYGFNPDTKVFVGSQELNVVSIAIDKITVKTTDSIVGGNLTVSSGGVVSNSIPLSVKTRGFEIYPKQSVVKLQPGDSVTVPVAVSGISESVSLDLVNNNTGISAYLKDSYIKLNGTTMLEIALDRTIANGQYTLAINGTDGISTQSREVTVQVGAAFEFTSNSIPPFMEGVTSSYIIDTENGDGDVIFRLKDGDILPSGLRLSRYGELIGKVYYGQASRFVTVIAEDGSGREISKVFEVKVLENSWPLPNKTGGNSRFNPTPSPSESRVKWSSRIYNSGKEMLVANNRVFVKGSSDISVLDANSGTILYTVNGVFAKYFYSSDTLFTLDGSGNFTAWDIKFGSKLWDRTEVVDYTTDGFNLLIQDNTNCKVIDITDGQLKGELNITLTDSMIWFRSKLIKYDHSTVYQLLNGSWAEAYSNQISGIYNVVADDNNLVIISESGTLETLDRDFNMVSKSDVSIYQGELVLTDDNVIVYNNGDTAIVDRNSLEISRRFTTSNGDIVAAKERLFAYGLSGLEAINVYDNSTIWGGNNPIEDAVLVGEELFTLDSSGNVSCHNGRDNIHSPTTVIRPVPAEPDGRNDYYITIPDVSIESNDPETYVKAVWYKYGENASSVYSDRMLLPDGEYSFTAYGVDSKDLRGITDIKYFKVDTSIPVTTMTKTHTLGEAGYTISDVNINLSAFDTGSGLDEIYYTLNSVTQPFTRDINVSEEGNYSFTWWSEDIAGNIEAKRTFNFDIDQYAPVTSFDMYKDSNSAVVYLFAEDSSSGVKAIEYRVNGGEILTYLDPINLATGQLYNVTFRAIDHAGHATEWQDIVFDATDVEPVELIEDFETEWGVGNRYVHKNVQEGDKLYLRPRGNNIITYLPDYLKGGDMIMSNYNDKNAWEDDFYEFEAGADIDLFIVKNRDSKLKLNNKWTKIAEGVEVAEGQFIGGAEIYYRAFKEGAEIEIGGTAMWQKGGPNLIIARESLSAQLNIFSPNPSKELHPVTSNWFAATKLNGELGRSWSYKLPGKDWVDLGTNFSGNFKLPYSEADTTVELKVDVKVPNIIDPSVIDTVTDIREYNVTNLSSIKLNSPVSGSQVLLNRSTKLHYKVVGVDGKVIDSAVSWFTKNGSVNEGNYTPARVGLTNLTAQFNVFEDNIKKDSVVLNVVDNWKPELFNFNKELVHKYKKHSDSRYYGFTEDHRDRLGETTYVIVPKGKSWSKNRVTRMYIAFEDDEEFNYLVNNGLYKVKVTLGPVRRNDYPFLRVENELIDIDASHQRKIYEIETTVEVADNMLTLSGSDDLQVISMEVLRTDTGSVTVVTPMDTYKIIKDQKWYKWNPEHYFPDKDDDEDDDDKNDEEGDDLDD